MGESYSGILGLADFIRDVAKYQQYSDNEPISIIGRHLDLTITSTSHGWFMYWKGMEPPELLGKDTRLVAYIPNLAYQEGTHVFPVPKEGMGSTEIVTDYSDESYTDRHVYMAHVASGRWDNELPKVVSADDLSANAGNEDVVQHKAKREKNCQHEQCR